MQAMFAKRARSPETTIGSSKKPKTWNPRDHAQAPVRKIPFPTQSLSKDLESKPDIASKLKKMKGK